MEVKTFALIVLAELLAFSMLGLIALAVYVRKLKAQIEKLRANAKARPSQNSTTAESSEALPAELSGDQQQSQRMAPNDELLVEPERLRQESLESPSTSHQAYTTYIDEQLESLLVHHSALVGAGDIALDIDPSAPLERRIAAVRHAVLIAEREATLGVKVDWQALTGRYKQLLDYYEETSSPKVEAKIQLLTESLDATQNQLAKLEKYRQLYFELEAKWHESRSDAESHYQQLTEHVGELTSSNVDPSADGIKTVELLDSYHRVYEQVHTLFEAQEPSPPNTEVVGSEVKELRRMTEQQNHIINDLKARIKSVSSDGNERVALIRDMEQQFERQKRFIMESEACVKLMEDELNATHNELASTRAQLKEIPHLKTQLIELNEDNGVGLLMIDRLKGQVTELEALVAEQTMAETPAALHQEEKGSAVDSLNGIGPGDTAITASHQGDSSPRVLALEQALDTLQKQYVELEERYLDMKL